jgi:pentatricopeptide repeat protein
MTFNPIIALHCQRGNLQQAHQVLARMLARGIKPTVVREKQTGNKYEKTDSVVDQL